MTMLVGRNTALRGSDGKDADLLTRPDPKLYGRRRWGMMTKACERLAGLRPHRSRMRPDLDGAGKKTRATTNTVSD